MQALLQHTPSTQKPLTQAASEPHDCPAVSVPWHAPSVQNAPEAQLLAPGQDVGQPVDAPEQRYG